MKKSGITIKFNIQQEILKKSLRDGRKIRIIDVSRETGICTVTLNRLLSTKTDNTWIKHIVLLCDYFNCTLNDLVNYEIKTKLEVK